MIREAIAKLAEGLPISREEAYHSIREIMDGTTTSAQIAALMVGLRIRGDTPEIIAGAAQAMREHFTSVDPHSEMVVDTCGTGGDGAHTFNISTGAALVTAGAGVTVAKHGNRSVSSRCGSADVLASLGVNIAIDAEAMSACLKEVGIAFLFAPSLHPAMKHAIGPRKEIGIRTLFNILGPLSNPAGTRNGVLGVYHRDLVPVLAEALAELGARHMFVVHGDDGLDEITTTTATYVGEVKDGTVRTYEIRPEDFGLPVSSPSDLRGGSPEENAMILSTLLDGEQGPRRDILILNAAAAITAGGKAPDLNAGLVLAAHSIDSGAARTKLDQLIAFTQRYAG